MKIYLDTVGCRLNQSEIEQMGDQFRRAGHILIDTPVGADLVVVNTCAVTGEAASDSRQKIRQAQRAGAVEIVATGCWVSLDPQGALAIPGVMEVIPNSGKAKLVSKVLDLPADEFEREPIERQPLPGLHLRTRAFIKVQDGCDNHCTYCVTRIARGASMSIPLDEVLRNVGRAVTGKTKEVVLTGVHLGSWGQDFTPRNYLYALVRAILSETNVPRLRLSSVEPWNLDDEFFNLWYGAVVDEKLFEPSDKNDLPPSRRICRHLHLPLQSGAVNTLRRMGRKTTPHTFARLISQARKAVCEMAITTDIMVGFPGETEADFEESLDFVQEMNFAGGHVFTFSPRPGTPAAAYPNQIPVPVKKERSARMRSVVAVCAQNYEKSYLGRVVQVLWEASDSFGPQGWRLQGLTDNYLKITAYSQQPLWNQFSWVRVEELGEDGLMGKIIP